MFFSPIIVGMSKMGFLERNCSFCFCLFYVGERQTEKKQKQKKDNFNNAQKHSVWGVGGKKWGLPKVLLDKLQPQFVFGRRKKGHFRQDYLFWDNCPFYVFVLPHKHYKNGALAGTGETENSSCSLETGVFGKGL